MAVAQFAFDLDNNFFRQLFCMCCLFGLIEIIQANITKGWRCCLVYVLWQVAAYFICAFLVNLCAVTEEICERIITAMLGSVLFLEGGLVYTVLGVVIFLANKSKKKLMVAFACFSLVFFALNSTGLIPWGLGTVTMLEWRLYGRSVIGNIAETMLTILGLHPMEVGGAVLYESYQWMLFFAWPFLYWYNGERGRDIKGFFYIFYPVHLIFLGILSEIV